jgi:hypothetical protein
MLLEARGALADMTPIQKTAVCDAIGFTHSTFQTPLTIRISLFDRIDTYPRWSGTLDVGQPALSNGFPSC